MDSDKRVYHEFSEILSIRRAAVDDAKRQDDEASRALALKLAAAEATGIDSPSPRSIAAFAESIKNRPTEDSSAGEEAHNQVPSPTYSQVLEEIARSEGGADSDLALKGLAPLNTQDERRRTILWLQHQPGINDLCSGALPPWGIPISPPFHPPISPEDGRLVCLNNLQNYDTMLRVQPNRLMSVEELRKTNGFPEGVLGQLPPGYHTTVRGFFEVYSKLCQLREISELTDDIIIILLANWGGEQVGGGVLYPEDLVPCIDVNSPYYVADSASFWASLNALGWKTRSENSPYAS